jgi:type VI secretion system protein ImpG
VLLGCTPATNLFPWDADPVLLDRSRSEYALRPAGGAPSRYEIHSITRVEGLVRGAREPRVYRPLFHFKQSKGGGEAFYQVRRRPALLGTGVDHYLSLTESGTQQGGAETLSSSMLCTNRGLPARLSIGDLRLPGNEVPPGVQVRNLGVPTVSVSPATAGDLHWRLLSHLNLNYSSVVTVEGLRAVFGLYDLRALVDRQAEHAHQRLCEGIIAVRATPATRLLDGVPVRGLGITLEVREDALGGTGEAYLLGCILDSFVGQYAGLNTFTVLSLLAQPSGEVHTWPARLGRRPLL